jgi:predicted DNA binding protein
MSTVAYVEFDADTFLLGAVFEQFPGATVELERIVPTDEMVIPYFWVRGISRENVESLVEALAEEATLEPIDSVDGEHLMRASWDSSAREGILNGLTEAGLTLASAVGATDGWRFELRGDEHEDIGRFRSYCRDRGIPLRLAELRSLEPVREAGYGLTDKQREALVVALRHGYYDSPRRATLEEVAAELGISRQALASRLRRGNRRLIEGTLDAE